MWDGLTEETRALVLAVPDPATDVHGGLASADWRGLFHQFLSDNGADAVLLNWLVAYDAAAIGSSVLELFTLVNAEGERPVPLSDDLYVAMAAPSSSEEHGIPVRLQIEAGQALEAWWDAFVDECIRMRHWDGRQGLIEEWDSHATDAVPQEVVDRTHGMPVHTTMALTDLDRGYIDRVNEYELKELEEGASTAFVQMDDYVLIGTNFPPAYVQAVEGAGTRTKTPSNGVITMTAKGGTFSAGKLDVRYGSPDSDSDNCKVALRRVTKKTIRFA